VRICGSLARVALLDVVQTEVARVGLGEQREQLALLKLVRENRSVGLASRTNRLTARIRTNKKINHMNTPSRSAAAHPPAA
jgi:hypothetical protein